MIDPKYKQVMSFVSCKTILLVEGTEDILVARRGASAPKAPEQVDLPGGAREAGESPYDTCRRECMEEIGIDIAEAKVIGADMVVAPTGGDYWLLTVEVSPELAAKASPVSEMSEVWTEAIGAFLARKDAWIPFQIHAHKILLEVGRTKAKLDYSRLYDYFKKLSVDINTA